MEEILIRRLADVSNQIINISERARGYCHNLDDIENAEIIASQLEVVIGRFSSELNNYFRFSKEHDADKISEFSEVQLNGEFVLTELKYKIKRNKGSNETITTGERHAVLTSKLPKLDLPEFDGDVLTWYQFWDQFNSNIGERNLAEVDKLLYLKSSLRGEAKKAIEGLDTTNKNYQIAVTMLKERYGKDHQIIDAHYAALYRVKSAENSIADCRRALDEIERHLRVLQSLGEDIKHNHLRFLIMEKFPEDVIYELKGKLATEFIDDLRKQLEVIIAAKEDAKRIVNKNNEKRETFTIETLHVRNRQGRSQETAMKKPYVTKGEEQNSRKCNRVSTSLSAGPSLFTQRGNNRANTHNQYRMGNRVENESFRRNKRFSNFTQEIRGNNERRNSSKPQVGNKRFRSDATNTNMDVCPITKRRRRSCIFCQGSHYNDECKTVATMEERKKRLEGRCFLCLRLGHRRNKCTQRINCIHCKRQNDHNRALCPRQLNNEKKPTTALHVYEPNYTILQTAVVYAKKEEESLNGIKCRVLLDSGSQRTYITRKSAKKLDLEVSEKISLSVFTFGAKTPQEFESEIVKICICTRTGKVCHLFANVVPVISQGIPYPEEELRDWNKGIILADDGSLSSQVDILIGNDYYFSIMSTEKIRIKDNLFLVNSELGWILTGKSDLTPISELSAVTYFQAAETKLHQPDLPLDNSSLKCLWDLESIGICDSPKISRDEEVIKHFNETVEFKDNRYVVCWPWNEYPPNLPLNYGQAHGRLVNLIKRLDKQTLMSYDQTLKEQLEKGMIERVPNTKGREDQPIHYLPHHGVCQPGKPVRIVYDASSKSKNSKSLNECLYCGPMMLEDLTGLLIRFRTYPIGIIADVEKAFLQIALKEKERDVTRFLWVEDLSKPAEGSNLLHLRFSRVPFGIICSPFLLNATIRHHLSNSENNIVRRLAHDIYVDNLVTGANTIQEAELLYKQSKKTFEQISMNLREWNSNSEEFMEKVHEVDSYKGEDVKVLGLNWDVKRDMMLLRCKVISQATTKREVLKIIASIYDPCGYSVPCVLAAKIFMQELWKKKLKWDTPMSEELQREWVNVERQLKKIQDVQVPRAYFKTFNVNEFQIHCFTDASIRSYAAVVYLTNGHEVGFIMGKSRLVPIKDQDYLKIPRLELLGVLIGSRLVKYVKRFLPFNISRQTLWTDSQIVIDWYESNKLLPPFVARRIEEIKRNQDLTIRYVPTELNPADVATRPYRSKDEKNIWLTGPYFIKQESSLWPTRIRNEVSLLTRIEPSERKDQNLSSPIINTGQSRDDVTIQAPVTSKRKQRHNDAMETRTMVRETLKEIKETQEAHFPEEIKGVETNLSRNLGLFKDIDGVLRCKGRMNNANWTFDKRYPILIPRDSELTDDIIMKTHTRNYHVGANHTLSLIRETYWIPKGKSKVQRVLKRCLSCIKHGGGPYKLPHTPALPSERVNYSAPFTFVGIDYLGPVIVSSETGTSKRWICLFVCLAVRAIHLEVVLNCTAEEGLLALRRMTATRGVPTVGTSDNAAHFKLISEIFQKPFCTSSKIQWRFIPQLAPWHGGFYERLVGIVKHCLKRTFQKHLLSDSQLCTSVKEIEAVVNTRPLTCVDNEIEHVLKPSDFLSAGKCLVIEASKEDPIIQGTSNKVALIQGWKKSLIIREEFKEMFANRYLPSLRDRYSHSPKEPRVISRIKPCIGHTVQIKGDTKNREVWKVGKITELIKGSDGYSRVAKVKVGDKEYIRSLAHLYPLEIEENVVEAPATTSEESCRTPIDSLPENNCENPSGLGQNDEIMKDNNIELHENNEQEAQAALPVPNESSQRMDTQENDKTGETRHKRDAAVKAREKMREWSQQLLHFLD